MSSRERELSTFWDGLLEGAEGVKSDGSTLEPTVAWINASRIRQLPDAQTAAIWSRLASAETSAEAGVGIEGGQHKPVPGDSLRLLSMPARRWLAIAAVIAIAVAGTFMLREWRHHDEGADTVPAAVPVTSEPVTGTGGDGDAAIGASDLNSGRATLVASFTGDGDRKLGFPGSVAFAPDGTVWIMDLTNDNFQIFDRDGNYLETWGVKGSEPGQFDFGPRLEESGAAVFDQDGNLFVADSQNHRIQVFDRDRTFLRAWGSEGNGDGQFLQLQEIALGTEGNVFVLDIDRLDVQVFEPDGKFLFKFTAGTGYGNRTSAHSVSDFSTARDIEVGPDGSIWILNYDLGAARFDQNGVFQEFLWSASSNARFSHAIGMSFDSTGKMFFLEGVTFPSVHLIDSDLKVINSIDASGFDMWETPGSVSGIAVDSDNAIYLMYSNGKEYRLQKFKIDPELEEAGQGNEAVAHGTDEGSVNGDENGVTLVASFTGASDHPLGFPGSVAFHPDGTVWVMDLTNDNFQIFDRDGNYLETWGVAGSGEGQFDFGPRLEESGAAVFDQDENLFVADSQNHRIQVFDRDRIFVREWGSQGDDAGQFLQLQEIALGPDGNVYALDLDRRDVQVFAPSGEFEFQFTARTSELSSSAEQMKSDFSSARDIEVGPDGSIWILNYDYGAARYDRNGVFQDFLQSASSDMSFSHAMGMSFDATGVMYFLEGITFPSVHLIDSNNSVMASVGTDSSALQDSLNSASGIAVDSENAVYVMDWSGEEFRVQKFIIDPETNPPK